MPLSPALQAIVARLSAGGRPEVIPPTTLPSEREAMLDAIAAAAARDPRVKAVADGLYTKLADRLGRAPTRPELLQWLMDSVHLLADYAPDTPGEEVFQSVQYTLWGGCGAGVSPLTGQQKGCADCEDQAALLVALCLSLGIRARVRWLDQPGSPLNHVSAMALLDGGQWICTDATIPGARPGETPYQALDRVGPGFRSRIFGLENAAGGIFAPAGYPAPMRYRPAGTNAEVRVMNLMQLPRTSWQFMLDYAPVTPIWTTPEGTVLFRTTSGQHTITIIDPLARSRTWNLTVAPGATALDWSAPDVAIFIHDFPTARVEVTLDGAPVGDRGGWADYSAHIYRVLAPIGRHTLRIADASGAARAWVGDLDAGGRAMSYADIQPERRIAVNLGSLRILNMIPNARVLVDDVDRTAEGNWIAGSAPYTWGDLSLAAGAHTVSVLPRSPSDGPAVNARPVTVNAGAQTTMETGWLPRAATPGSPPPTTTARLVIVGMPAGGAVAVNGTNIPHERSLAMVPPPDVGAEGLNWPVPVAPGNVTVRVTPPAGQGPARTATLMVPATGAAVRFSAMTPEATSPVVTARLVIVGMPAGGAVAVNGTNIPHERSLAMVPPPDVGAEGLNWPVPVAPGNVTVRVTPPAGQGPARTATLMVPATGAAVRFSAMTPEATSPVVTARLVIVGMPAGGAVAVNGTNIPHERSLAMVPPPDVGAEGLNWPVPVAPGNVTVRVTPPAGQGPARTATLMVPATGAAVRFSAMTPEATSPVVTARLVIVGMPAGGAVAVNGTNIPHERSLAMVPPPDVGAEGLNWPVPVAPGNVTVRVTPPAGQGPARTATLMVPATGAAVRFSAMTPEATGTPGTPPSRASEIEVRNIIPGSRLFVNGADVTDSGRIVDVASRTFAVPAPAGPVTFRVVAPDGTARIPATPITVPSAGAFTVDWDRMVPDVTVTPDSSVPATSIQLVNAPTGISVALDGLDLVAPWVTRLPDGSVKVGALPGPHILRVFSSGSPRTANVTVPLTGSVAVDYNTMSVATDSGGARVGRIVVRGAPTGISPARVVIVGGVSGDPAQSQPLTPQSDGYLAVTWPVGPARLQVGTFDVPVTVILGTDSVYDYTPAGLVFQPLVTNARMAPNAGTGPTGADPSQGSVVLSGVPLPETAHAPIAVALGGASQYVAEMHGGGPVVTLRPSGTDFVGNAAPGTYVLTVYLETSEPGRPATRSPRRSATVNLTAGQIERVSWSDMTAVATNGNASPNTPVDDAHSRMSLVGVPDGWTFAVDGLTSQPPEGLTRGPHTVVLRNPQGVTVQREVTLRNAEETVDMAYDVARALQFNAGHDGVVNVTEDGLRNGYPSTFSVEANRSARWLTPAEERRVMREFDVVGAWRDAAGRMPVALYFKGAGITVVPLTPAELLARAKNLPKRGSRRKDGTYVNDLRIPT